MPGDLVLISHIFREGNYIITEHAGDAMDDDQIDIDFIEEAIGRDRPRIIENYSHSCLILGWAGNEEPVHAVIAISDHEDRPLLEYRLVTVYRPDQDPERWNDDFQRRR